MNKTETIQVLGHTVQWEQYDDEDWREWTSKDIETAIKEGQTNGYLFQFRTAIDIGTWKIINPLQEELDRVQGELDHYKEQYYKIREVDNQIVLKLVEKVKQWKGVAGDMYSKLQLLDAYTRYDGVELNESIKEKVETVIKQYEKLRDNAI